MYFKTEMALDSANTGTMNGTENGTENGVMSGAPPGVKVPDPQLKATIDKTVGYVVKNGPSFEDRLKANESSKVKFPFIYRDNEYYGYYLWRLGRSYGSSASANGAGASTGTSSTTVPLPVQSISPPPDLKFLVQLPPISSTDLKILKLTALFTARNGDKYLQKLYTHQIEKGNKAQFQFIEPSHSLHQLFQQFIGQYKQTIEILGDETTKFPDLLVDSYQRAQYTKQTKVKQHNEAQEMKQRQLNYASIDWQDFAMIGKIEFDDIDKVTELAVPLNRQSLIYRSLEAKTKEIELETGVIETREEEREQPEQKEGTEQPEGTQAPEEVVPHGMKIRAAGESRLKKRTKEPTIRCPITNQMIPELRFDEHIRILLRDPHYEQEKQNYITKNFKYSSNLTNDEVYDNIKRLTKKRKTG